MKLWLKYEKFIPLLLIVLLCIPVSSYAASRILTTVFTNDNIIIRGQDTDLKVVAIKEEGQQYASTYVELRKLIESFGGSIDIKDGTFYVDLKSDIERLAEKCKPSCVLIYAWSEEKLLLGSGWFYDGYIITAKHVVENANTISVFDNYDFSFGVSIVPIETDLDIAILKLDEETNLPSVELGNSDTLIAGEKLVSISSPNAFPNAIDECIFVGHDTYLTQNILQISETSMGNGSSGGAIFNFRNTLVGMVFKGTNDTALLIPVNDIKPILDQLDK